MRSSNIETPNWRFRSDDTSVAFFFPLLDPSSNLRRLWTCQHLVNQINTSWAAVAARHGEIVEASGTAAALRAAAVGHGTLAQPAGLLSALPEAVPEAS